jgi:4-hydroxy-tetrahydrodipicolinate synthase
VTGTGFCGVIVPMVTPLDERGEVSERSVQRLVASVRPYVNGLMPALTSGEGWRLSAGQWRDVVAYTKRHAGGLPVLAGVHVEDTAGVIERARIGEELGVDAVVVTTPFGAGVSQEQILEHYLAIREALSLPIFIYNEAAVSGNAIEFDTMLRICRIPGVAGVKESSGSVEFTNRLVAARTGVPVLQGWEHLLVETPGVDGCVLPLANIEPGVCAAMVAAPSPEQHARILALCERHGLLGNEWFVALKQELVRRGVIDTAVVIDESRGVPA